MKQFAIIALISCLHFSPKLFSQNTSKTSNLGTTCNDAIPVCANYTVTSLSANSSGQVSSCFGSAPQRDIWLAFHVIQSGDLAWMATPNVATTEFDWTLWDVTSGCPGTAVCCNYNYAGGSTNGFGMQAQTGTLSCGSASLTNDPLKEFSPPVNVTVGKKYALQISNYDNTAVGFSLSFINSTCLVDCALGLSENEMAENEVSVYPVPATNELFITSKAIIQSIELTNLTGQSLTSSTVNQKEYQLHLDSFSEGIYFLKMIFENEKVTYKKIVISK